MMTQSTPVKLYIIVNPVLKLRLDNTNVPGLKDYISDSPVPLSHALYQLDEVFLSVRKLSEGDYEDKEQLRDIIDAINAARTQIAAVLAIAKALGHISVDSKGWWND